MSPIRSVISSTLVILVVGLVVPPSDGADNASSASAVNGAHTETKFLIMPMPGADPVGLARFHAENHCERVRGFPALHNVQVLLAPQQVPLAETLRRYQNSGLVEYAEPDYRVHVESVFANDPAFLDGTLWGLNNAGQNGGLPDADIDAPEAWSAMTSASNVIVAVVDTGIRYTHEDLVGNIWTNPLDGSHGTNVLTGSTDPNDDNGHGTLMAGVIGAMGNNGVGVVGVAWRVQLMACKFADASNGSVSGALAGLDYARTNGAHIINASWGLDEFSLSLSNAISSLRAAGILVVAAAGNQSRNIDLLPRYPASYDLDNVIAVAATTRRDELYPLSNVGATNVDLAAPGSEIYSTAFQSDSAYAFDEGTSMATAYVSGAAALVRAAHPADSPAQIIARLLAAADPLPGLDGMCVSGGRLNLRKALAVTLAAPLLNGAVTSLNGSFVLRISADPGRDYVVEATTNLLEWIPVSTNLTGLTGSIVLTNILSGDTASQFYRARLAP
ncbi:MAG TPA: S8 family peptidase [Verrucomicrobiae bacterium]|nr:S8 family peptidase [Verrucomicrobiae bacterium]